MKFVLGLALLTLLAVPCFGQAETGNAPETKAPARRMNGRRQSWIQST